MNGTVRGVNSTKGFVAIETSTGEYTLAELLGGELELGDQVKGNLESLGGETLHRIPSGERLEVYIQNYHADAAHARKFLSAP